MLFTVLPREWLVRVEKSPARTVAGSDTNGGAIVFLDEEKIQKNFL